MIAALFVKDLDNFRGEAKLYKLSEPIDFGWDYESEDVEGKTEYVVASGISNEFGTETFIFATDQDGKVLDWGELEGSFSGGIDHQEAIDGLLSALNAEKENRT